MTGGTGGGMAGSVAEGSATGMGEGGVDGSQHLLSLADWSREALEEVLEEAARLKTRGHDPAYRPLAGRTLGMIFAKSSTRTRVSFEVGMYELGGHALFLSSRDIQLGRGEPIADTARVLSRYLDGIMIRTFAQEDVVEMARYGSVPVVNGLTDLLHPCQVLADVFTAREAFGPRLEGLAVAWIGDGNNMANSWLNAARRFGLRLRLACPEGYEPDATLLEVATREADVRLVREPEEALEGARVVTTDVWASMGQEEESGRRRRDLADYFVDGARMERAAPDAIFLHCLPAHRGEEVASGVIDGPRSRVWDEAENRLHVQKAVLLRLLRGEAGDGRGGPGGRGGRNERGESDVGGGRSPASAESRGTETGRDGTS